MNVILSDLKKKRLALSELFDHNELYDSFKQVINDLNQQLALLKRELTTLKNQDFITKM